LEEGAAEAPPLLSRAPAPPLIMRPRACGGANPRPRGRGGVDWGRRPPSSRQKQRGGRGARRRAWSSRRVPLGLWRRFSRGGHPALSPVPFPQNRPPSVYFPAPSINRSLPAVWGGPFLAPAGCRRFPRHGADRQLCAGIEDLREKREEINKQISSDEQEKTKIQNDLAVLTKRLSQLNDKLAREVASRNEYDKTIQETEAAYLKILESSQTLLTVLKRESVNMTKKRQASS